ncbi:MAG TPA: NADH-quinone oxidoreductase subunit N, partial [Cytophagales bacterium]|nr:NADH-quinone oxidoreductase subunit N [Cytophagales bacterium]
SLSGYLATHLKEDKRSAESSMKYLLFGAVSSGVLLYSLSWVYGVTGTLNPLSPTFWSQLNGLPLLAQIVLGLGVTFAIAFKISAAPAHLWAPDVYETAPLPLVAFFSVVPKIAAATLLLRLGLVVSPETAPGLNSYWGTLWPAIIVATLLVGNLAALLQGKAMRLMTYSSIAHSGFLLLAALAAPWASVDAFRIYGLVYLIMNFAAFGLIQQLHQHTGTDRISQWKGWGQQLPYPAILLLVVMIALVGLPPTAGFIAKLITLSAVFDVYSHTESVWMAWAGGIGLFSTVVALFYYLKIPYFLFFKKNEIFATNHSRISYREVLVSVLTLLLLIGFFRSDLMLEALNRLF